MRIFRRRKKPTKLTLGKIAPALIVWDSWQPVTMFAILNRDTYPTLPPGPFPVCVCVRAGDQRALALCAVLHAVLAAQLDGRQPVTS